MHAHFFSLSLTFAILIKSNEDERLCGFTFCGFPQPPIISLFMTKCKPFAGATIYPSPTLTKLTVGLSYFQSGFFFFVFLFLCVGFLACVFFSGWRGAGPSTQPPTWRTSVSLFVWVLSFDLSGKGGPTSSYATAGIALWIIAPRKKNWMEAIRKAINERNINEGQWEDGKQWSIGVGQRRTAFWIYTYIFLFLSRLFCFVLF